MTTPVVHPQGGKFEVERESKPIESEGLDAGLIFEQEPTQILDSLLPLYLNAAMLRALQVRGEGRLARRVLVRAGIYRGHVPQLNAVLSVRRAGVARVGARGAHERHAERL